jgi:hypothetical protein
MQLDDARRAAQAEGRPFRPAGLEAKVEQLWQSYVTWRQLTFRATGDQMGRSRFLRQLDAIASAWRPLGPQLRAGAAAPREAAEAFEKALLDVGESVGQSTCSRAGRPCTPRPLTSAVPRPARPRRCSAPYTGWPTGWPSSARRCSTTAAALR